jgi:hypothetical protein
MAGVRLHQSFLSGSAKKYHVWMPRVRLNQEILQGKLRNIKYGCLESGSTRAFFRVS